MQEPYDWVVAPVRGPWPAERVLGKGAVRGCAQLELLEAAQVVRANVFGISDAAGEGVWGQGE